MKSRESTSRGVEDVSELQKRISRALDAAGREALIRHKREGQPIIIWRNGAIVKVPPEDITIPPAAHDEQSD